MDTMDKQKANDLSAVMNSPLTFAEDMHYGTVDNDTCVPPAYETIHNTEAKQLVAAGDLKKRDSTERKFVQTFSESEDSEDDTDLKMEYPIKDKTDLLKQIQNLQKEQETLRIKQEIHEKHIKDLLDCEPSVHRHFKSLRKSFSTEQYTKLLSDSKNASIFTSPKQQYSALTEEHIYVQLEQLYTNFHVLHIPSTTAQNILSTHKSNYSMHSTSEITILKKKVKQLEEELTAKKVLSLQPPEENRLNNVDSSAHSKRLRVVPGRPTSPHPLPPALEDLYPVEVTFKWTIANYSEKLKHEKTLEDHKEISCPFYLTHCGYRAQIEAYLNGNGTGRGKCMSVFLRIMKGNYDQHLKWPANLHLVVILVNQSGDHSDSLKAEGAQFQYNRPCGSSDGESDCYGLIEFADHVMIKQRQYINSDKIVLKCRVQIL